MSRVESFYDRTSRGRTDQGPSPTNQQTVRRKVSRFTSDPHRPKSFVTSHSRVSRITSGRDCDAPPETCRVLNPREPPPTALQSHNDSSRSQDASPTHVRRSPTSACLSRWYLVTGRATIPRLQALSEGLGRHLSCLPTFREGYPFGCRPSPLVPVTPPTPVTGDPCELLLDHYFHSLSESPPPPSRILHYRYVSPPETSASGARDGQVPFVGPRGRASSES